MKNLRYRLRFAGRPDLDRDDFETEHPYRPGDVLVGVTVGLDSPELAWVVSAVVPGAAGLPDTLVCDVGVQSLVVRVSEAAVRFASSHGGRIYVWAEPFGRAAARLRASAEDPGLGPYVVHPTGGVEVFVAQSVGAAYVTIRLSVLRRSLVAEVPGATGSAGVVAW